MDALVWLFIGLLSLVALGLGSLLYQVLRQQGRLLLRIEALERLGAGAEHGAERREPLPGSLPLATEAPSFRLPDLSGREVGLEDFRGRRVLLVHWDPGCGFCRRIAPELASLQGDLDRGKTELVLVSHRDAESNRLFAEENGLRCPILLQPEGEVVEAFARLGTPAAYLLDEKGRVAKPLALGAEEVPLLARAAAGKTKLSTERPLAGSRIEREGLKPGLPAPVFALDDLEGREVSLEEFRGRRVLLVFSDPDCGPCDALARDLARFHREHREDDLAIVMVSRGEADENRRKAAEHGIEFPIVIQPGWKISKKYGIFATPVAFLVDEEGVIAREVARGPDHVLRLASDGLAGGKEARLAQL